MCGDARIEVQRDADVVEARAAGRALAGRLGFSRTDATLIATAISEVARNIVVHAGQGEIELRAVDQDDRCAVVVVARDNGPGIAEISLAMQEGVGSGTGLGLGLPGARRLVDDFDIESAVGCGTTVTMCMWRERDQLELLRMDGAAGEAP